MRFNVDDTMGNCKYCGKKAGLLTNKHSQCEQLHEDGLREAEALFYSFLCKPTAVSVFSSRVKQLQTNNYLNDEDKVKCARKALQKFTDAIRRPYTHAIEKNVKQLLTLLNVTVGAVNKDGVLGKLSQKIVKGYLVNYFTNGSTETQVRSDVHDVAAVLPLSAEDENEAYMYVLNKAAENFMKDGMMTDQEERLIRSYATAFALPLEHLPAKYATTDLAKLGQMTVLKNFANGVLPSTFVQLPVILTKTESLLWFDFGKIQC